MPHSRRSDRSLRALLTQQRYSSVVIHNYCRSAGHFLKYVNSGSSQSARDVDWPSRVKFHGSRVVSGDLHHRHSRMEFG